MSLDATCSSICRASDASSVNSRVPARAGRAELTGTLCAAGPNGLAVDLYEATTAVGTATNNEGDPQSERQRIRGSGES